MFFWCGKSLVEQKWTHIISPMRIPTNKANDEWNGRI